MFRGGATHLNTNSTYKPNWALVLTFDDSDKDQPKQGVPRNLFENFRMVNMISQNWSYIVSIHLKIMGFPNPLMTAHRLLLFLQFFSSSLENHDFILYETLDREELSLESRVVHGTVNFSLVVKIMNVLLQKLSKNGFSEEVSDVLLFDAIKIVIQTQLNVSYSMKITSLFNSIFMTSITK